jgi:NAD(P)H-hydrate epimerase
MKILSAEQIRQWDQYTIKHEAISSLDLMERAAGQSTKWIVENDLIQSPIKIFCGKGNNGGDGLVIACQLAEKGITAQVYILETGNTGSSDFQANLARLNSYPVQKYFLRNGETFPEIETDEIVIDALFGSGLSRPLEGLPADLVEHINKSNATVISIDLPGGMFCDRSTIPHPIIKATHTLTFQTLKLCFLFPENEEYFGKVHLLSIGLSQSYLLSLNSSYELADAELIKQLYKPRKKFSHKGTYGHTLIVAGGKGKMGAALLSTLACLRSGSGLVTILVPKGEFAIVQTAAPEAMAAAQEEIQLLEWSKYSAIGLGPGLGTGEHAVSVAEQVLSNSAKPIVIDADALNIISTNHSLLDKIPAGSILTPHPKEFERLFGKPQTNFDRLEIAKEHALSLKVFIIVKGFYSLLACPDGRVFFNSTGNPGMATGGSGDVLTGILSGLLSQGYSSEHASVLGMYLHGLAGDLAARALSQEALIAGDIIDYLGKAWLSINS